MSQVCWGVPSCSQKKLLEELKCCVEEEAHTPSASLPSRSRLWEDGLGAEGTEEHPAARLSLSHQGQPPGNRHISTDRGFPSPVLRLTVYTQWQSWKDKGFRRIWMEKGGKKVSTLCFTFPSLQSGLSPLSMMMQGLITKNMEKLHSLC